MTKEDNIIEEGGEKRPNSGLTFDKQSREATEEYFRRLRLRLKFGLLISFLTPILVLSLYFHFQFNISLKESGKLDLIALAESQRNTLDLFLQERVVNIFSLFHSRGFSLNPTNNDMQGYLNNLRQVSDAFIDVGFFDSEGVQIGYAGPFPYLAGKNYSQEPWFETLLTQERNYYISDIYQGFRNKPHFSIAVRQLIDGKHYIIRATLDPDKFYLFMRNISRGKGTDSALINREGLYQVVDPDEGELHGKSDYMPKSLEGAGAEELRFNRDSILVTYSWLNETPWALVVRQPLSIAYARMYKARKIMIASTSIMVLVIIAAILFTTERLLGKAQATAESREVLQSQLLHASKLAALGELAAGLAHEINNPLATISAESGLIRDMLDPQFKLDHSPEAINRELDNVDYAVKSARTTIQKILGFARKSPKRKIHCDVNKLLDEVVGGLKEREFKLNNIKLVRNYDSHLPEILLDPDQIKQVFLNVINNAGDAIEGPGTITLSTRKKDSYIRVNITDTGKGMSSEELQRIFMPFYTTKEVGKGTGLGLSISASIVESMGGAIEVQSMPQAGSSFTVVLPIK